MFQQNLDDFYLKTAPISSRRNHRSEGPAPALHAEVHPPPFGDDDNDNDEDLEKGRDGTNGHSKQQQENDYVDERSPLLSLPTVHENNDDEDELPPIDIVKIKALASWKKLSDHVKRGSVLVRPFSGSPSPLDIDLLNETSDRHSRRQQAQAEIRKSYFEIPVWQYIMALVFYIGMAVIGFSFVFENWTVIDSVYFSVVTFSTIGYGDLVPQTYAAKCFAAFYSLSSIGCLGLVIGLVGKHFIEAQEKALIRAKALSEKRVTSLFSSSHHSGVTLPPPPPDSAWNAHTGEKSSRVKKFFKRFIFEFGMVAGVLMVFGAAVAHDPAIKASEVGYFLITTSTAVGYGDIAPTSPFGRLVTALFIPVAVGAMGRWLAMVAGGIIESRQASFTQYLETHELTSDDLDVMDEDGDGNVSRAEFIEFVLVAMGAIDRELVEQLRVIFSKLDADGTGVLSKGDLIAVARRKLKDPRQKLELAKYKAQLLAQGKSAERPRRRSTFWGGSLHM